MRQRSIADSSQSSPWAPTCCFSIQIVTEASAAPNTNIGTRGAASRQVTRLRFHQSSSTMAAGKEQVTVLLNKAHRNRNSERTYQGQQRPVGTDPSSREANCR